MSQNTSGTVNGASSEVVTDTNIASDDFPPNKSAIKATVRPVGIAPTIKKGSAQSGAKNFSGINMAIGINRSITTFAITTIRKSFAYPITSPKFKRKLEVKKIAISIGVANGEIGLNMDGNRAPAIKPAKTKII